MYYAVLFQSIRRSGKRKVTRVWKSKRAASFDAARFYLWLARSLRMSIVSRSLSLISA